MKVAGLFAGIGGIERGLHGAGHTTGLLCEIDPAAQAILAAHFPGIPLADDIRTLSDLPEVDLVAGGFPCQDLSQAGTKAGISGGNSGLVTCANDGSPVTLVTHPPAPGTNDDYHYDQMVRRASDLYDHRFQGF